ncbi:MAG: phosphotransferase [Psychrobacter sp.]|nr:phosphotransferase [Psychrobacter sp.]
MTLSTDFIPTPIQREKALNTWLQQCFTDSDIYLDSLPGDASFRRYHRLKVVANQGQSNSQFMPAEQHYIVMDAPPELESIKEFVAVDELLAPVVNVPDIIAKEMDQGFLVLQDFGTTEFAHLVADAAPSIVTQYYQQAIDTLIELQSLDVETAKHQASLPDYDAALLHREMDLFSEWFLAYVGIALSEQPESNGFTHEDWQAFKEEIVTQVLSQPQVVVHRDYHSRNLMQDCNDSQRLGVIDFQDAVIGAYSYDVVSLLRDAYVSWSETQIDEWLTYYFNHKSLATQPKNGVANELSFEQLLYDVTMMGIQRHLKILGIFVRLSERDGKPRYLADIPKVMQDLIEELEILAKLNNRVMTPAITKFKQWVEQAVLPAFNRKFNS